MHMLAYGQFSYKGQSVLGSCPSWQSFATKSIRLPSDAFYLSSMTATGADKIYRKTQQGTFTSRMISNTSYTCSDLSVIKGVTSALAGTTFYSGSCSGVIWNVQQCSNSIDNGAVNSYYSALCVNCASGSSPCSPVTTNDAQNISTCHAQLSANRGSAYVLSNPCQSGCDLATRGTASSFALMFSYKARILYPLFNVLPNANVTATTRSSITISVNTTLAGYVICSAYVPDSPPNSLDDVRSDGASSIVSTPNSVTSLVITGLEPQTVYSFVCVTRDLRGNSMPLDIALAQ